MTELSGCLSKISFLLIVCLFWQLFLESIPYHVISLFYPSPLHYPLFMRAERWCRSFTTPSPYPSRLILYDFRTKNSIQISGHFKKSKVYFLKSKPYFFQSLPKPTCLIRYFLLTKTDKRPCKRHQAGWSILIHL